tara:strand:+ start:175 stop:369 length:195 start_codon:yes stop_codon:yes gene_type:complete
MRAGDMVRFKTKSKSFFSRTENWETGLLIEYHTWEKIATILHEGNILRIHASDVQKAGKRDFQK